MSRKVSQAKAVPTVPGAHMERPLPQPQAMKWAGWAKRNLSEGGLAKVLVASMVELDRLAVGVIDRDAAGFAGHRIPVFQGEGGARRLHGADAPQRQFEIGGDLADGQALLGGGR